MKRITFFLFITLSLSTFAQVPSYVPSIGLVGWWPFNGNCNDESINGNDGTVIGAVSLTTDRYGTPNSAYSFPGNSSAYININQDSSFSIFSDGISLSVWFLSFVQNTSGRILQVGNTDGGNKGFHIAYFPNVGSYLSNGLGTGYGTWNNSIPSLQTNLWNHMVFTADFNSGIWRVFHNGNLILSDTSNTISPINFQSNPFSIGRKAVSAFDAWNGKIDDIGIWNRALTTHEIVSLYNECQLTISSQPNNQNVNINENALFCVSSSDSNLTFQWQTDIGLGFQNLSNATQFSGVNSDTLHIANVTMLNDNQLFRCVLSSGSCNDTSDVALLTVNNNIGIIENAEAIYFSVFPNPSQSIINLKVHEDFLGQYYSIYDNLGRIILMGLVTSQIEVIDLSSFSNGFYFIKVGNNNQKIKLLKYD